MLSSPQAFPRSSRFHPNQTKHEKLYCGFHPKSSHHPDPRDTRQRASPPVCQFPYGAPLPVRGPGPEQI